MKSLAPDVIKNLSQKEGLDQVMTHFFEMVANGTYPLDNIVFLLWTEVVKWYKCSSTTQMRYLSQTKLFWKLGLRLFGKRFINYMGGFKSHGELVLQLTDKGKFSPGSSDINFAVPDTSVLRNFDPYNNKGDRKPGIYEDTIQMLSENLQNMSACITFDGKKIKQGLTEDSGDVDLLGYEKQLSLAQKKKILECELMEVRRIELSLLKTTEEGNQLQKSEKDQVIELLQNSLTKISEKVNSIVILREKKEYCKQKLIERGGDSNWRKGRYAFAVSAIIAFIYEIDELVKMSNSVVENICRHVAYLNNAKYIDGNTVNLTLDEKYKSIETQKNTERRASTRFIQQRSTEWWKIRNQAVVTGSTLYGAVGCDGLCKQKDHFEKGICGIPEKEPSESVKQAMQHGIENEENAVGTIVGKVMPVLTPDLNFCEEGCVAVDNDNRQTFMVVSPDGSLRNGTLLASTEAAIEIKCPTKKAHTKFPERYLLQCLAEIHVLNILCLFYISWTEDVTTVFKVYRNDELLAKALKISMELYGSEKPRKPTKLTQSTKDLKDEIVKESKKIQFVGRFPSCKVSSAPNKYDNEVKTSESTRLLLADISKCYTEFYELQRERATEAVVFLVADLDRSWKRNSVRCSPVRWFPRGYSLDSGTMRNIAEEVHTMCIHKGIHVPCESFDGQWHTLVVRDVENQPLTLFQLQRDVWKHVERKTKKEVVDELKYLNKTVTWTICEDVHSTDKSQKRIIATNGGLKLPQYRYWQISKTKETHNKADSNVYSVTLSDSVPDVVRETADIGLDVMAMTAITDDFEMEAFSCNTNDDEWSRELQYNDENLNSEEGEALPIADSSNKATGNDRCNINNKNLDLNDMECLLSMLKTTKDCNKKMQWNSVTPGDLLEYFTTYDRLSKLLDVQVRVIVRYLKKTKGMTGVKESSTKKVKLDGIAKFLGIEISDISDKTNAKKRTRVRSISTLHALAAKALSKYSKQALNIILAEYIFENDYESWIKPIENITINGETIDWFYKPEYSTSRKQLEVKCIDSTHLFTRARRKTCAGGIEGMTNEAWTKVAKQKSTLLTPIMVEEISDPMSVSMARPHFSAGVEAEMRGNGDTKAANLCSDIRNWWESEDAAGISAECRIERRKSLRRRLLTNVKFNRFPPPTQYVHGWPVQLWEGLFASMDAKAYLYAMVHGGTYNVRAFSSLIGETFFSELTLNDKRGQGTVTALEFSQYIGHTTEQLQVRLDPDRKFSFCTSKTKVYDVVDESCESESSHEHELCRVCNGEDRILPHSISTKDHPFDKEERKRLEGRRNRGHVSTERNAVLKGSLGVRWEKARCNMSKMMPTKRMGISCDE